VYNGVWGKAPEAGEFAIFFVKSNRTVCKATFWFTMVYPPACGRLSK